MRIAVMKECNPLRLIFFRNGHIFSYPVSGNCIIYKKISYFSLLVFFKSIYYDYNKNYRL